MSYIYSESYIRQKLRRLEEVNEYNKAKLAMYAKKKNIMSKNEYERYKKILFGTDYRSQRESLANSTNNYPPNIADKHVIERNTQQKQEKNQLKNDEKLLGQVSGNILQKGNKKQSIRSQQQENLTNNNNPMSKAELQRDGTNKEGTFQTPKQQQQFQGSDDHNQQQQGQEMYLKQHGVFNTASFKSTLNSQEQDQQIQQAQFNQPEQQQYQQTNQDNQENQNQFQQQYTQQFQQQHGQSNSESILHQTYNYEDSVSEQTQLLRNIRIIEMEKRELQSQLEDLAAKENFLLNSEITYRSNKHRSLYEDDHLESISSVQNPLLASKSFRESLQSSPTKIEYTQRPMSSSRRKSYNQMQKNIGLDFNSQWEMLEKWENVGKKPTTEKLNKGDTIGPLDWINEEPVDKQIQNKSAEKNQSSVIYPQRIVHSFLNNDNWETQFNKIGKTYEERQMIVDSEINYFGDFLGRNPNPKVHTSAGKNYVTKYTIDQLSDDIEQFMKYTRFRQSQSSNQFSPFQKKRGLFEIPEEQQSHETTLNY